MPEIDRVAGKVVGYRAWRISSDLELMSTRSGQAVAYTWDRGPQKAKCRRDPHVMVPLPAGAQHSPPGKGCHCGFNAHHDLDMARRRLWQATGPAIMGAIVGWGNLQVHWDGVRSEYAQIVALGYRQPDTEAFRWRPLDVPRRIADRYGVPLVPLADLEAVAREHGEPYPEELRPPELVGSLEAGFIGFRRSMKHLGNQAAVAAQQLAKVNEYFVTDYEGLDQHNANSSWSDQTDVHVYWHQASGGGFTENR
jgi:hypothetical protein